MKQHPTAIIDPGAEIAGDVEIGPFVIIEGPCKIGPGCRIMARAHIMSNTETGSNNIIHMGAVIGHEPQHLGYKGWPTFTRIGDSNIIREYVTIHRSWVEGEATIIGNECFLMATSHVAHDCLIGNNVTLANGVLLAGHVTIEDGAFISGNAAVHQFGRVGRLAMLSGLGRATKDVPPFCTVSERNFIHGLNLVGLRRAGISPEARKELKRAFQMIFLDGGSLSQGLEQVEKDEMCDEVKYLVKFIRESKRGVCSLLRKDD